MSYQLPPNPQHAILNKIYPWEEYNLNAVLQWLYTQAQNTGFNGTFDDFRLRYGAYVEASDPQDIYDLIKTYTGPYEVTPISNVTQILETKNKVMNDNITIHPATSNTDYQVYNGSYNVTPIALVSQLLRTSGKVLEENITVAPIPYAEVSNTAGGTTVIIG